MLLRLSNLAKRPLLPISFRFYLSSQDNKQSNEQDKLANQRAQRAKEIDFRKRMMEEAQIKKMNESIRISKDSFNPLTSYLMLFKRQVFFAMFVGLIAAFGFFVSTISGIQEDPFTKKKKFVLISDKFEQNIKENLKQTFLAQFERTETVSEQIQQQCQQIESAISKVSSRHYRISLIQADSQVIIVLPSTIIASKKIFLGNVSISDITSMMLLMQALFAKKNHIKKLAFSNILPFIRHRIHPSNVSDLNMIKIYAQGYSQQEIWQAVKQISKIYQIPVQELKKALTLFTRPSSGAKQSVFSLQSRLNGN